MRVLVQFRSSPSVHAATLRGEAMPDFAATTAFNREEWLQLLNNMSQW